MIYFPEKFYSQPPFSQQHKRNFIAGSLGFIVRCNPIDFLYKFKKIKRMKKLNGTKIINLAISILLGLIIGLGIGVAIGAATNNIVLWMSIGVACGLAIGASIGILIDNRKNKNYAVQNKNKTTKT